jgi:hypothetical protein
LRVVVRPSGPLTDQPRSFIRHSGYGKERNECQTPWKSSWSRAHLDTGPRLYPEDQPQRVSSQRGVRMKPRDLGFRPTRCGGCCAHSRGPTVAVSRCARWSSIRGICLD